MADTEHPGFYNFKDLVAMRIVGSRSALSRLIIDRGFPRPEKFVNTMQAPARWRKAAVHQFLEQHQNSPASAAP